MNLYEKHKISSNVIKFRPKNRVLESKIEDFSKIKNAKAEVNNTNTIVLERLIKSLGLTREPL